MSTQRWERDRTDFDILLASTLRVGHILRAFSFVKEKKRTEKALRGFFSLNCCPARTAPRGASEAGPPWGSRLVCPRIVVVRRARRPFFSWRDLANVTNDYPCPADDVKIHRLGAAKNASLYGISFMLPCASLVPFEVNIFDKRKTLY